MKQFMGVLVLLFIATGFVAAQAAVTQENCTIEWANATTIRITNKNEQAVNIQYSVAGKDNLTAGVEAGETKDFPYKGKNANGVFKVTRIQTVVTDAKAAPAAKTDAKPAPAAKTDTKPAPAAKTDTKPAPAAPAKKK
ncbi:MAG: hypothetical protein LBK43_08780 [Treponema sp.]|jgi:hypothetical protein|nr:hypothetical protein [Treponema sp.]